MSDSLLQLKQTLFVLVLLHDHTSHFRTREVTHGRGQTSLRDDWVNISLTSLASPHWILKKTTLQTVDAYIWIFRPTRFQFIAQSIKRTQEGAVKVKTCWRTSRILKTSETSRKTYCTFWFLRPSPSSSPLIVPRSPEEWTVPGRGQSDRPSAQPPERSEPYGPLRPIHWRNNRKKEIDFFRG